ncbi:DUF2515 family protein [Brevibacillus fluminis]|uniref:DUF2515 family protein n=1 Tax=Brevibacillus fluminis TaxID=511487 RepID=UPI003F89ACDA
MQPSICTGADVLSDIRHATALANRNNVTRTEAYLRFYLDHPEIEWAMLAHLVSRNGGWNMTDLKGDWLPLLLDEQERGAFFHFLERCNWLIFHDAYAQLLLYATMKQQGDDLTELLVPLGISRFMIDIWREFLQTRDSVRLTHGLIINEQHYIEQRVVQKPFYRKEVLDTLPFHLQSWFSFNHLLFPYHTSSVEKEPRLCGITVHRFASLEQRIRIGKSAYSMLRADANRFRQIVQWAKGTPHTGSRADYWPGRFTSSSVRAETSIYSPTLADAWKDTSHAPADGVDWYRDRKWLDWLGDEEERLPELTDQEYGRSLQLMRAAIALLHPFSG